MKKPKDFKASIILLIGVIIVVLTSSMLFSCSGVYKCPTYSGTNKEKYKKFKSYSHSKPLFSTKNTYEL